MEKYFSPGQDVKVREGYDLYPGKVVSIGRTGLVRVNVDRSSKLFMLNSRKSFKPENVVALDEPMCIVASSSGRKHWIDKTQYTKHHLPAAVHPRNGRYVTLCCKQSGNCSCPKKYSFMDGSGELPPDILEMVKKHFGQ